MGIRFDSRALASTLLLLVATPPALAAGATRWMTCYTEASGGEGTKIAYIVLEPFEYDPEGKNLENPLGQFDKDPGVSSVVPGYERNEYNSCDDYATREQAQAKADRRKGVRGYAIVESVAWQPPASVTGLGGVGSKARATSVTPSRNGPTANGGLTVGKNTALADAAKAWDEQVRAQLRKEAQARAALLAKSMQADAQRKVETGKLLEAMRKRGRAQ
jgi:hypothetical protein